MIPVGKSKASKTIRAAASLASRLPAESLAILDGSYSLFVLFHSLIIPSLSLSVSVVLQQL
jgi:hypothetical protein